MKTRTGFVSNSSSSSFCIFGCILTDNILNSLKEKANKKAPNKSHLDRWSTCRELGLSTYRDAEFGDTYVGLNANNVSLETLQSFKEQLVELIGDEEFNIVSGEYEN